MEVFSVEINKIEEIITSIQFPYGPCAYNYLYSTDLGLKEWSNSS
jgi:hypothetical protein